MCSGCSKDAFRDEICKDIGKCNNYVTGIQFMNKECYLEHFCCCCIIQKDVNFESTITTQPKAQAQILNISAHEAVYVPETKAEVETVPVHEASIVPANAPSRTPNSNEYSEHDIRVSFRTAMNREVG